VSDRAKRNGVRLQRLLSGNVDALDPGQFTTTLEHQFATMITVVVCCPVCSSKTTLSAEHKVDEHGFVSPAVKCSNGACPFLEYIQLDGWRLHV